ncbi:hypothetical protein [Streptococcus danieliae]|uniref:hypothetical protein n=1 Tax=Streptococcus danieliae TaxID=747656 RepID=UPI0026F0F9C5|nr:hypothetical protein [Streptococcus danieliae]
MDKLEEREKLVKKELSRLRKLFVDIPENKKKVSEGLMIQAARLRILLNDLWQDISKNGDYELFSQSENQEPYERERPAAKLYNSRDATYHKVIKQLIDLLPEEKQVDPEVVTDGSDLL